MKFHSSTAKLFCRRVIGAVEQCGKLPTYHIDKWHPPLHSFPSEILRFLGSAGAPSKPATGIPQRSPSQLDNCLRLVFRLSWIIHLSHLGLASATGATLGSPPPYQVRSSPYPGTPSLNGPLDTEGSRLRCSSSPYGSSSSDGYAAVVRRRSAPARTDKAVCGIFVAMGEDTRPQSTTERDQSLVCVHTGNGSRVWLGTRFSLRPAAGPTKDHGSSRRGTQRTERERKRHFSRGRVGSSFGRELAQSTTLLQRDHNPVIGKRRGLSSEGGISSMSYEEGSLFCMMGACR